MRLLLLSDLHGNLEALNAITKNVKYDMAICMGDLVDYGPDPLAVIDWIRDNRVPTIRGNHDNAVALHVDCGCGYKYKHLSEATREYTWSHITEKEEEYLLSLPTGLDFAFDGLKIRAIHGSPLSFFDYIYPDTPADKVEQWLKGTECDYLIAGHTHVPMIRKIAGMTMLNPGSAGQPRDGDWRASCMVFDTAAQKHEIVRLEYDIEKTCDKIRASMPHADELIAILKRGY
ncbi:MAG: phosphodiesterase [Methanocella sp. PtaU1.Bin125]|nr:MAG: phosphodiesterase [Methanocella sp. PtaU1.Bin125]